MSETKKDNLVNLAQFKRRKRLKAKARKQSKREQSRLNSELKQTSKVSLSLSWHSISMNVLLYVGASMLALAQIGQDAVIPYMQGGSFPLWLVDGIAVVNVFLPALRNVGGILAGLAIPSIAIRSWKHGLLMWPIWLCLLYWSFTNTYQWTEITTTNAGIGKVDTRQSELESKYDVPAKRQRYEDAKVSENKALLDKDRQCSKNDGSLCQAFIKTTVPLAVKARESAWHEYQQAKEKAESVSHTEMKSVVSTDNAKLINTGLPLIGGILLMSLSLL